MLTSIISHLPQDFPWLGRIHCFETIGSTNTHAKNLAAAGAPEGTVVLANMQTGGRGRLGRSFHSPGGSGIYMSVVLRPRCNPAELMHLTCAVGTAMCGAIEESCGFRPGVKWINDLVSDKRKLGGILTELSLTRDGTVDFAIVGVGINCCQQEADFPEELRGIACSLAMATGRGVDMAATAAAMIAGLEDVSGRLLREKAAIMASYRRDCVTLRKEIQVLRGDDTRCGIALDVDDDGALTVLYRDGSTGSVNSGEVSVRGMYGYV